MSPTDILALVNAHLAHKKQPPAAPASPRELSDLTTALNLPLPRQLAEWLSLCRGGYLEAGSLVHLLPPKEMLESRKYLKTYNKPANWLPIADDGCGDYYCLVCPIEPQALAPVVFLDHEDGTTYLCGSSVFKFLEIILNEPPRVDIFRGKPISISPIFEQDRFFAVDPDARKIPQYSYGWL